MSKKAPSLVRKTHELLTALIELHEQTATPLMPSPISEHLGEAIEAVMMVQTELLFPSREAKEPKKKPLAERQTTIKEAGPENGQPPAPPVLKR